MNREPLSSWSRTLRLSLGALALGAASQASAELVLHENDDFSGRNFRAYVQIVDLSTMNFNDRASSVVVRSGAWQLCSDSNSFQNLPACHGNQLRRAEVAMTAYRREQGW